MLSLLGATTAAAQPPERLAGPWRGVVTRDGATTTLLLDLRREGGAWRGTFGFPDQRVLEYPLDRISVGSPNVTMAGPGNAFTLDGVQRGDTLSGTYTDSRGSASFQVTRDRDEPPYTTEAVSFANGQVTLAGSLSVPVGAGPHPAVVFLHGSGPEIRWGASRFFADYFARRGIASLIFDKRGTGQSTGDWRTADFDDLAGDALAAVELVKGRGRIDARRIGIHGHSQGGTIAPMIAARSDVAFVISAASSAVPMWQSEVHSLRTQTRAQGVSGEALERADRFIDQMVDVARTGIGWDSLHAGWRAARERAEPWAGLLEPPARDAYFWSFYPRIANYDASEHWRQVTVPVLVIEAGADVLIPVEASVAAIDAALRTAANRDYTIVVLPGAPHNLVLQPDVSRGLPWPRVYPGYPDLLTAWIRYRWVGR